jgi:uncharacterized FlaG/YvyC family protein
MKTKQELIKELKEDYKSVSEDVKYIIDLKFKKLGVKI